LSAARCTRSLIPPLVTAVLIVAAGVFADSHWSPLAWVKWITAREYTP
jgi:multicomponent Na+:H+ antiporter subunit D